MKKRSRFPLKRAMVAMIGTTKCSQDGVQAAYAVAAATIFQRSAMGFKCVSNRDAVVMPSDLRAGSKLRFAFSRFV